MVEAKLVERAFADGRAAAERAEAEPASRDARGDADGAESEADPLEAARTLLRRAAASAVAGRLAQAGAAVKLAEGLARAAAALGLGDDGEGAWDDADEEPRLSPGALEALRDDVERRYARFDLPGIGADPDRGAWTPTEAAAAGGAAPAAEAAGAAGGAAPAGAPAGPGEAAGPHGIGGPTRSLSVSPWPAWAGPPDGWACAARRG